jgi:hypothetical protein
MQQAMWTGRWAQAAALAAEAVPEEDGPAASAELLAALASGDKPRLERAAVAVERLPKPGKGGELFRATLLALANRNPPALALIEGTMAPGNPSQTRYLFDPLLANLREEPRYATLLRKAGLFRFWRESGKHPDICKSPDAPRFCRALKG